MLKLPDIRPCCCQSFHQFTFRYDNTLLGHSFLHQRCFVGIVTILRFMHRGGLINIKVRGTEAKEEYTKIGKVGRTQLTLYRVNLWGFFLCKGSLGHSPKEILKIRYNEIEFGSTFDCCVTLVSQATCTMICII